MNKKLKIINLLSGRLFSTSEMLELVEKCEYKEYLLPIVTSVQSRKADSVTQKCFHDLCGYMKHEMLKKNVPYSATNEVRRILKILLSCYCIFPEVCEESIFENLLNMVEEKKICFMY